MYIIRSKETYRFWTGTIPAKWTREYPAAWTFTIRGEVLAECKRLHDEGYLVEIVKDYGLETEQVIE